MIEQWNKLPKAARGAVAGIGTASILALFFTIMIFLFGGAGFFIALLLTGAAIIGAVFGKDFFK
jgi:hypothetical protein